MPTPTAETSSPPEPTIPAEPIVLRRCARCRKDLPESDFNKMGDGRQAYCRPCFRAYYVEDRKRHQARNYALKAMRIAEARRLVLDHLLAHPCLDCGEPDPVILEFDHVRGTKAIEVARLVHHGVKAPRLLDEIAKCDVVCVACHRHRTARRAAWRRLDPEFSTRPFRSDGGRRNTLHAYAVLRAHGCMDCREPDLVLLDFDHRGVKNDNVMRLASAGVSLSRLDAEIALCEVRCVRCHRRRTAQAAGHFRTL